MEPRAERYSKRMQPEQQQPEAPVEQVEGQPAVQEPILQSDEQPEADVVHWQASEYIHHEKSAVWFTVFGVVVVAMIAIAWLLLKSPSFAVVIVVMAVAVVALTFRPPHTMSYTLSTKGLYINDTLHNFSEFRGFALIQDHGENSIMMLPVRRFQPGITVYFPADKGEEIVDMLGVRLPMEERKLDPIDKLVHMLRF